MKHIFGKLTSTSKSQTVIRRFSLKTFPQNMPKIHKKALVQNFLFNKDGDSERLHRIKRLRQRSFPENTA